MKSDQKQKNARFHQIDFIIIAPAPAQEPTEKFPQRRGSPRLRSHLQRSRGRRGKPCLYREGLPPSAPYCGAFSTLLSKYSSSLCNGRENLSNSFVRGR